MIYLEISVIFITGIVCGAILYRFDAPWYDILFLGMVTGVLVTWIIRGKKVG